MPTTTEAQGAAAAHEAGEAGMTEGTTGEGTIRGATGGIGMTGMGVGGEMRETEAAGMMGMGGTAAGREGGITGVMIAGMSRVGLPGLSRG